MIKITRSILLGISILLFIYVIYRSEIYNVGFIQKVFYKYYLIATIFFILAITNFFINEKKSLIFIITFFLFFLSAYLLEGFLSINTIKLKKEGYQNRQADIEFINNLVKGNQDYVPVATARKITTQKENLFSLSGISKKKTIHCNENGYYSIYNSDRYGFNNPDVEWGKTKIDYFLIGDSFVHGACVNPQDTIGGVIRKINNKNTVLSLGLLGNGPLAEYATLREYLPIIKTKKVIWFYYEGNDLLELSRELKKEILSNYFVDKNFSQNLQFKQNIIDEEILLLSSDLKNFSDYNKDSYLRSEIIKFLKLFKLRQLTIESFSYREPLNEFEKILDESKKFVEINNAKLYFVYLPEYSRFILRQKFNNNHKKYHEVIKIVKKLNIPVIDIYKEVFKSHKDPLSFFPSRMHGHYTELGYKIITEKLISKINEFE